MQAVVERPGRSPAAGRRTRALPPGRGGDAARAVPRCAGACSSERSWAAAGDPALPLSAALVLLIGPPGSGKTTALANSGLKFPLADRFGKDGVRGVGGTRNCDWLFTDEAVLLDTAGRYTTQDSDEAVDRSAWQGFLNC